MIMMIMNQQELLNRITFNQKILRGKPVIRGLRISVEMILELLGKGATIEEILEDYPDVVGCKTRYCNAPNLD